LLTAVVIWYLLLFFQALRHLYVLATRPRPTNPADDGAILADDTAESDAVGGNPTSLRRPEPLASEIGLLEARQFVDASLAGSDRKPWFANDGLKSFLQLNELSFVSFLTFI